MLKLLEDLHKQREITQKYINENKIFNVGDLVKHKDNIYKDKIYVVKNHSLCNNEIIYNLFRFRDVWGKSGEDLKLAQESDLRKEMKSMNETDRKKYLRKTFNIR